VPIPEPKSCRDAYIMCRWYGLSLAHLLEAFELVALSVEVFALGDCIRFLLFEVPFLLSGKNQGISHSWPRLTSWKDTSGAAARRSRNSRYLDLLCENSERRDSAAAGVTCCPRETAGAKSPKTCGSVLAT
jgi:hypothetical protein